MRILITEEALQTGKGHWPAYIGGIADGLRAAGDEVDVLVHSEAALFVLERTAGTPWFSRNCWVDARSQGSLGGIRHNFIFRAELSDWLHSNPPYDWICALTMRLQHLLALALLARGKKLPSSTRCLLLFVQGFGQYAGPGQPTTFPNTPSNRLARFCFRLLGPAVRSGRVVLASETRGMQDELQRFTRLPVSLFPHPVPPAHRGAGGRGQDVVDADDHTFDTLPSESDLRTSDLRPLSSGLITITCPGFARHEKGNDLLQQTILAILSGPETDRYRFIMQWPEPFIMPDGSLLGPDPKLLADPRVEFMNQSLDADAYESLLARTDLVILPYRRHSYHHRVSRVAIEAASRGIPLVYTAETWCGEVAAMAGGGVEILDETAGEIASALRKALAEIDILQGQARCGASSVAAFHSNKTFRSLLANHSQPS